MNRHALMSGTSRHRHANFALVVAGFVLFGAYAACGDDSNPITDTSTDTDATNDTVADTFDDTDTTADAPDDTLDTTTDALDTAPEVETFSCSKDDDCTGFFGPIGFCELATCNVFSRRCIRSVKMEGTPCNDLDACTQGDFCRTGTCIGAGATDCDDKNPCTIDSCIPRTGCAHTLREGTCDDGNACTTDDRCNGTKCAGQLVTCDDSNPCTADHCDPVAGCVYTPLDPCPGSE